MIKKILSVFVLLFIATAANAETKKIPVIVVIDKGARAEFRASKWGSTQSFVQTALIPQVNEALSKNEKTLEVKMIHNVYPNDEQVSDRPKYLDQDVGTVIVPPKDGILLLVTANDNLDRSIFTRAKGYVIMTFTGGFATEDAEAVSYVKSVTEQVNQ